MPNLFKDNAAPYVIVLLVSGVGWLISQAYNDLKSSYIVEYNIEYIDSQKDRRAAVVTFKNLSHKPEILNLEIRFKCKPIKSRNPTATKCYEADDRKPVAQSSSLVQATVGSIENKLPGEVLNTSLKLPSGTEAKYFLPLLENEAEIRFEFVVKDNEETISKRTILANHADVRVLVLKYFLDVAVWAFGILVMMLGIFALVSLVMAWLSTSHASNERGGNSGRKNYKVIVTDDGN